MPVEWTTWRGSKLTRMQADSLRLQEIIRPPMFVTTSSSRDVAEVFRDVYLIKLRAPAYCRSAGLVRQVSGVAEVALPPYTPLRVVEIGQEPDFIIGVEIIDLPVELEDTKGPTRAFPI